MPWLLLASAAIYRVLWLDALDWYTAVILIASSFFFLAWGALHPWGCHRLCSFDVCKQLNSENIFSASAGLLLRYLPPCHAILITPG